MAYIHFGKVTIALQEEKKNVCVESYTTNKLH